MTTVDDVAAKVAASRAAQGLPPKVTDPATLRHLAALAVADAARHAKRKAA